jgi:hypothetical protein
VATRRLTWKDGLATVFIGLAVVLFAVWSAGAAVTGVSGRGLVVAIFLLGIGGFYTAQSHFETVYGVNGTTRPPLAYVVLISVGALATVAGVVAVIVGGTVAVTTLLLAMVVMWILATIRHQRRASAGRVTERRRSVCAGDRRRRRISRRWCPG